MARRKYEQPAGIGGSAAIEAAILMPVLLLLTLGIVEVGRMVWVWSEIRLLADEAARLSVIADAGDGIDVPTMAFARVPTLDRSTTVLAITTVTIGTVQYHSVTATSHFLPLVPGLALVPADLTATARLPVAP